MSEYTAPELTHTTPHPGLLVTEVIRGAHPKHVNYPLLPQDLLVKNLDGTYLKVCPGLAVGGFQLTTEQAAQLTPVEYTSDGLHFTVKGLT